MGVLHGPETDFAKEARKWEAYPTSYGPPGRPYVYRPYPAMMYRVTERNPLAFESHEAADEQAQRNMESRGWAVGQEAAVARYDADQKNLAVLAANRAYQEQRMSPEARAEAEAYEASVDGHVAEIPETPRRGRPPKAKE